MKGDRNIYYLDCAGDSFMWKLDHFSDQLYEIHAVCLISVETQKTGKKKELDEITKRMSIDKEEQTSKTGPWCTQGTMTEGD